MKPMKANAFSEADELPIKSMKPNAFNEADEQPSSDMVSKPRAKVAPKKKDEDVEMLEDDPKPVLKKPPNIGQKPAAKKPAVVAKPAAKSAAVAGGADEEDGSGLSKEEAIEKVEAFFSGEVVSLFDGDKW